MNSSVRRTRTRLSLLRSAVALVVVIVGLLGGSSVEPAAAGSVDRTQVGGSIFFTFANIVQGDPPPSVVYNLQVSCGGASKNYKFTGPDSAAIQIEAGTCDIQEWFTSGVTPGYTLVSSTKNQITDRAQSIVWVWQTRTTRATSSTSTTTTQPVRVPPKISVDPVDFGNLLIGKTATRQTTIRNIGTIAVAVRTATVPQPFTVSQPNCDLAPGATCTLDVTYSPTAPRADQALLTVSAIGANALGAAAQAPVTGNSEDRGDVLLSTPQFQPTAVGQTSPVVDATLTNVGSLPFNVKTVAVTPPFLTVGNKCPVLLQPGQTCAIQLAFRPTVPGPASGTLSVSLAGATLLDLKGSLSAVAPVPPKESIVFDPTSGSLGNVPQGSPPTKLNVRLVNSGSIPVTVSAVGIPVTTGKGAKKKTSYVASGGGVTVAGACKGKVLQPREACNLVVTSVNTPAGPRVVNLTALTTIGTSATFSAKGRVLRRGLSVSGPVQLGLLDSVTPRVAKVTVSNSGELPVVVSSVALTNGAKSGFSVTGDLCSKAQLAPGAKCTLNVQGLLGVQPSGAVRDKLVVKGTSGEVGQG